ncbi:acyltransferase family protein [Paenibacillus sp. JJ1683]
MKLKYLEGLRGFAAFVVVIFHFLGTFYPSSIYGTLNNINTPAKSELLFVSTPLNVLYNGNFAVCIFFVLSGFVLSIKFFKTKDLSAVTESAIKRYFRLVIPVIFSVLIFYFCFRMFEKDEPNIYKALYEGFIGSFFSHTANYNVVLWTMSFEFMGSFIVFLFCALFGKSRNRIFFYFLFILLFWKTYYLGFVLGLLLCDFHYNNTSKLGVIENRLLKWTLLILALLLGSYPNQLEKMDNSIKLNDTIYAFFSKLEGADSFYHSIGAFIILLVVLNSSTLKTIFSSKFMNFIGEISFSMYLIHNAIIFYFSKNVFYYLLLEREIPYVWCFVFTISISIPIIFFISVIYAKWIDKKSVSFSNYMYRNFFKEEAKDGFIDLLLISVTLRKLIHKIKYNYKQIVIKFIISVIIILISVFLFPNFYKDNSIKLELYAKISKEIDMQIYYTTKLAEFDERNSVLQKVYSNENFQKIVIQLPVSHIERFRVDFGSYPGQVYLGPVRLIKSNTKRVINMIDNSQINQMKNMDTTDQGIRLNSNSSDPYIVPVLKTGFGDNIEGNFSFVRIAMGVLLFFILSLFTKVLIEFIRR